MHNRWCTGGTRFPPLDNCCVSPSETQHARPTFVRCCNLQRHQCNPPAGTGVVYVCFFYAEHIYFPASPVNREKESQHENVDLMLGISWFTGTMDETMGVRMEPPTPAASPLLRRACSSEPFAFEWCWASARYVACCSRRVLRSLRLSPSRLKPPSVACNHGSALWVSAADWPE